MAQPIEIPQPMRDVAVQNVEQARAAYDQFMGALTQATSMWSKAMSAIPMTSEFDAVHQRAARFAKQNAEAAFALAKDLANAKDAQEMSAIQTRYVHMQMQAYALQTHELSQLMTKASQSIQPPK